MCPTSLLGSTYSATRPHPSPILKETWQLEIIIGDSDVHCIVGCMHAASPSQVDFTWTLVAIKEERNILPSYLSELSLGEPPDERRLAGPAVAQHHHRATHPARHLLLVRHGSRRWGVVMYVTTAAAPTAHS